MISFKRLILSSNLMRFYDILLYIISKQISR